MDWRRLLALITLVFVVLAVGSAAAGPPDGTTDLDRGRQVNLANECDWHC